MDSNPGLLSSALIEFGRCGNYCCHSMTDAKQHAGFAPLETLPAEWYNNYNYLLDTHINQVQTILRQAQTEIANVLEAGGQTPDATSTCQLLPAINCLIADARPAIATGSVPGLVASSNASNAVSVNGTTGVMTPNALCDWSASTTVKSCIESVVSGTVSNATLFAGCSCAEWKSIIEGSTVAQANSTLTFGGYTYEQAKADIRSGLSGNTGTVTSVSVYCDSALVQTITESGSICLSKNAFNTYAEISTSMYPGACCTGTSNYVVTTKVCCSATADTAGTSSTSNALSYTGTGGISSVTANQTLESYCGSPDGVWASYLIFNHGDGASYYHQMLRMPFSGVPQYQQLQAGVLGGWRNFITDENIGFQSVACATNAVCLGGICGADFFHTTGLDINSDCWSDCYNYSGSFRDGAHSPSWAGSIYAFSYPEASQTNLLFRVLGGSDGPNQVQMNYGIDRNRFGMNWATIINSENIGSQHVCSASALHAGGYTAYIDSTTGIIYGPQGYKVPSTRAINEDDTAVASGVLFCAQTGGWECLSALRSYIGGIAFGSLSYNVISSRWKNGASDGNVYGSVLYQLHNTSDNHWCYRKQHYSTGWTSEQQLIDTTGGQTINGTLTATTFCGNLFGAVCATSLAINSLSITADSRGPIHLENSYNVIHLGNDREVVLGYNAGALSYGIALGNVAIANNRGIAAGSLACAASDAIALGAASNALTDAVVAIGARSCATGCRIMHMRSGTWRHAVFSFAKGTMQCVIWNWLAACGADYSPMWPAYECSGSYCGMHRVGGVWQMRNAGCSEFGFTLSWDGDSNIDFTTVELGSEHPIYKNCTATIAERIMVDVSWETEYR